jgi:NADH-quinone oxidoreductase subunit G
LQRAAAGELDVLVLLGADPIADFPDRELARRALDAVATTIYLGTSTMNIEGRVTRLAAKVPGPALTWAPWAVASELAARLGSDFALDSLEAVSEEIAHLVPGHSALAGADTGDGYLAHRSGSASQPLRLDPMATPGIASVESQGAQLQVGAVEPTAPLDVAAASGAPATLVAVAPSSSAVAPRLDSYSYRLVVRRNLYDLGTAVQQSPSLRSLVASPTLSVHPLELAQLGLASGDRLRLRAGAREMVVAAVADDHIARRVVALVAHVVADGTDALDLLDATTLATDVRLETLA